MNSQNVVLVYNKINSLHRINSLTPGYFCIAVDKTQVLAAADKKRNHLFIFKLEC